MALDVCIRGSGIVGRTLALLLARDRLRVGLVEHPGTATGAASDVRAYALNTASMELLERLRVWPDEVHATPVLRMEVHGDEGGDVTFDARDEGVPALTWIVDVGPLHQRLGEALRYQPGVEMLSEPQPAALTVVCEGRASATRDEFGVHFDVTPYGQHAIAARLECERKHAQVAMQWFSGGDIIGLLPLGEKDGNSVALVWSVDEARVGGLMDLAPADFEARLEAACGGALGKMSLTSERAAWSLQLARADRWTGAGWALAGDAAHNVHPLSGQGLNLGLADVQELAQVLHAREAWRPLGDARLLRRYERARKGDVLARGLTTDGLQRLFAMPQPSLARLRNWGMSAFDRSGPLKHWVVRQAMGLSALRNS